MLKLDKVRGIISPLGVVVYDQYHVVEHGKSSLDKLKGKLCSNGAKDVISLPEEGDVGFAVKFLVTVWLVFQCEEDTILLDGVSWLD